MYKERGRSFWYCLQVPYCSCRAISAVADSQIAHKTSDLGYPPCTGNMTLWCMERHPLLMKCFKTFFRCIRKVGRASNTILQPLMGHIMPFQLRLTLKLHINTRFGLPLEQETYDDVLQWETFYCCWSVSYSSLDVWVRWEELLTASNRAPYSLHCGPTLTFHIY